MFVTPDIVGAIVDVFQHWPIDFAIRFNLLSLLGHSIFSMRKGYYFLWVFICTAMRFLCLCVKNGRKIQFIINKSISRFRFTF